ncbi:MAG: DUF2877 domain-containing protein [Candidatus Cloacimonadales bacterium]
MDIMNFGTEIAPGKYRLHSRFATVYNYQNAEKIISLVTPQIGFGPNNIVCSKLPAAAPDCVSLAENNLRIGTESFSLPTPCFYHAKNYSGKPAELRTILVKLGQEIPFSDHSLGFLLQPHLTKNFTTTFQQAFLHHMQDSIADLTLNSLPQIATEIKGAGFGLTPSGDDFICGALYALHYLSSLFHKDYQSQLQMVYQNALGANLISNTFLYFAYQNKYYRNFYRFLEALASGNPAQMQQRAKQILTTGHSSGSDTLTGFIFTMKEVMNDQELG